jgi:anti-sigma regulatory factor (Ser/Thr protein kinase)
MTPLTLTESLDDWLAVSTEGFATMNAGREPAHLVKELVQNALDAIGDRGGRIDLTAEHRPGRLLITCRDNGCGMNNLTDIRTVFHTSKTDSHLQRGRMGRGFKEMLCLAEEATVTSGRRRIEFLIEDGRRITRQADVSNHEAVSGTLVRMLMPWNAEVITQLQDYFRRLLVPQGADLQVNGRRIEHRTTAHRIEAKLPTELLETGRWIRPVRNTVIELIKATAGEEPTVYEMGIPICSIEWDVPYHANVQQRVPMNPCRDAVASGYLVKLHRSCLPLLLAEMNSEQVRADWVGGAVPQCAGDIQKEVIRRGFGDDIARSVPPMGVRQFDEDAREIGKTVIDTRQTSGGFRQILQEHVPTTREVVNQHNQTLVTAAAAGGFAVADVYDRADDASRRRRELIESVGGKARVETVMAFARWFCQKLLDGYGTSDVCSVTLAQLRPVNAIATWSSDDVLTLGIDTPWLWTEPFGEETLTTLIHECAHALNAHHGRDFHKEMEKLAGRAARIMLLNAEQVRRDFGQLL